MVWYGWIAYALLWLTVLFVFPIRVDMFVVFSLFDAKMGVRVGLYGIPAVRIWANLSQKELLLNGKPYLKKHRKRAHKSAVSRASKRRKLASTMARVHYEFRVECLAGFYESDRNWLLSAMCDLLSLPHVRFVVHPSGQQVCKGFIKGRLYVNLWDIVSATLHSKPLLHNR